MERENMTIAQEIRFIDKWFDKYEKEGFVDTFANTHNSDRAGQSFKVLGRLKPHKDDAPWGKFDADIDVLPMWLIEFKDGYQMTATPEEIIPSEVKKNAVR